MEQAAIVLVGSRLTMRQQHALTAAETSNIMVCMNTAGPSDFLIYSAFSRGLSKILHPVLDPQDRKGINKLERVQQRIPRMLYYTNT